MTSLTDPVREFADACEALNRATEARGDDFLASQWGVTPWSTDFLQILFSLSRRADEIRELVEDLDLDDDYKSDALAHLQQIRKAFSREALNEAWDRTRLRHLAPNLSALKMLSGLIRQRVSYAKLSENEYADLMSEVEELVDWLVEHQLSEQDFVRQALLEGLKHFHFRLQHVRWLGWGYTVESLREVIGAYLALERGFSSSPENAPASAILKMTSALLRSAYAKTKTVKEGIEVGDWVLRAYGAATLFTHSHTSISGLLASLSNGTQS